MSQPELKVQEMKEQKLPMIPKVDPMTLRKATFFAAWLALVPQ